MRVCLVCAEEVLIDENLQVPRDAVRFTSYGNFGSTVFDPLDGSFLEIQICDKCMVISKDRIRRVRIFKQRVEKLIFDKVWNPEEA